MAALASLALLLGGCGPAPDGSGTAVDALTDAAIAAGVQIAAYPSTDAPQRCQMLTADIEGGGFQLVEPCRTTYTLATTDGRRVTPQTWEPGWPLEVAVWPIDAAPPASGALLWQDDTLTPLAPVARVLTEELPSFDLRFPDVIPVDPPDVGPGAWLVVIGGQLHALPASPAATVAGQMFGPWRYLGAEVGGEGGPKPVAAPPSDTRALPDIDATFVPSSGLPPGMYAVQTDRRLVIVEFTGP